MKDKKLKFKELKKGFQEIPVADLNLVSWNYKKFNDQALQKKLVANIKRNGQIENLITYQNEENGLIYLCNGNHRYLALQELGYEHASCYHLGVLSDTKAKRIAVETNETKFGTDKNKLASIMDELLKVEEFSDFNETNPFDDKEMNILKDLLDKGSIEIEDDEAPVKKKTQKSKTVVSAGGETYTTVNLELTPELAKKFSAMIDRLSFLEGSQKPIEVITQLVAKFTNEEILEITGNSVRKKKAEFKIK